MTLIKCHYLLYAINTQEPKIYLPGPLFMFSPNAAHDVKRQQCEIRLNDALRFNRYFHNSQTVSNDPKQISQLQNKSPLLIILYIC